jgi:hypothetical protein
MHRHRAVVFCVIALFALFLCAAARAQGIQGTVSAWGDNTYGELGNGTMFTDSNTPVPVSGLSGVTAIGGGFDSVWR